MEASGQAKFQSVIPLVESPKQILKWNSRSGGSENGFSVYDMLQDQLSTIIELKPANPQTTSHSPRYPVSPQTGLVNVARTA